jgi:hypothetical protein
MKNLLTPAMLLIAMALTFTSCKKDDDNQNSNNNLVATALPIRVISLKQSTSQHLATTT